MLDFRLAAAADSPAILAWRNDVHARSMMLTTDIIDPQTHEDWFTASLSNPDRIMIISQKQTGDDKADAVAIVRFDVANGEATVSINMNPAMRGQGLAAGSLIGAEQYLPRQREIVLIADIKSTNIASRRTFERAGYQTDLALTDTQSSITRYRKIYLGL